MGQDQGYNTVLGVGVGVGQREPGRHAPTGNYFTLDSARSGGIWIKIRTTFHELNFLNIVKFKHGFALLTDQFH